jgi:hypothetical protein
LGAFQFDPSGATNIATGSVLTAADQYGTVKWAPAAVGTSSIQTGIFPLTCDAARNSAAYPITFNNPFPSGGYVVVMLTRKWNGTNGSEGPKSWATQVSNTGFTLDVNGSIDSCNVTGNEPGVMWEAVWQSGAAPVYNPLTVSSCQPTTVGGSGILTDISNTTIAKNQNVHWIIDGINSAGTGGNGPSGGTGFYTYSWNDGGGTTVSGGNTTSSTLDDYFSSSVSTTTVSVTVTSGGSSVTQKCNTLKVQ